MHERLLTIAEVAKILALSPGTIRHRPFREKLGLHAVRIGGAIRFRKVDIDDFIERNTEHYRMGEKPN